MSAFTIRLGERHQRSLDLRFGHFLFYCCVLSVVAGCAGNDSWAPATGSLERLRQVWGEGLPEALELLGHQQSSEGAETWIVFSPQELLPPSSGKIQRSECPVASLASLLRGRGISQVEIGTFQEKKGMMWEWETPSASFRVRAAASTKGWISCIEQFPAGK